MSFNMSPTGLTIPLSRSLHLQQIVARERGRERQAKHPCTRNPLPNEEGERSDHTLCLSLTRGYWKRRGSASFDIHFIGSHYFCFQLCFSHILLQKMLQHIYISYSYFSCWQATQVDFRYRQST